MLELFQGQFQSQFRGRVVPGQPLIVVAVAAEAADMDEDAPVLLTGIGRLNATLALTDCLHRYLRAGGLPSAIINVGTAGALRPGLTGVHRIDRVILHDFSHAGVAALTGRDEYPPIDLETDRPDPSSGLILATGDVFVEDGTVRDRLAPDADLVDMEGYAVAAVAQWFGVPVQLAKIVSDAADDDAGTSWHREMPALARELAAHSRHALGGPPPPPH
ncbi:nucleosidase [Corynebacterium glyciniphilum]|uniref:nucleosidase n=1 Tax=Corynebacterium glyciniphilum TaxID=1404244 RepID=UPI00264B1F38|nr:nucleosidase [Corynebacterium glyciniphilum]MDN5682379.1 nucleosidase [Corynebacterium glyciniphilum]MDN6705159.1 nucleosidase [Corynebacterium glyciniphilum]